MFLVIDRLLVPQIYGQVHNVFCSSSSSFSSSFSSSSTLLLYISYFSPRSLSGLFGFGRQRSTGVFWVVYRFNTRNYD